MKKTDYEKNHRTCRALRTMLADDLYMPQPPNEYSRLLSSLLQQLHSIQGAYRKNKTNVPFKTLSVKQMAVVDKALTKYNKWLTKDSTDADFMSNKKQQMKKLKSLLSLTESYYKNPMQLDSEKNLIWSMIKQLEKRKLLLTNKQKLLCNEKYKEINTWKPWYDNGCEWPEK